MAKKRKRGQTISEYLILTALIAVGSIGVIQVLSSNLRQRIGIVSEAIRGVKKDMTGKELKEEHYKVRDLGDFSDPMTDNDDQAKQ